MKESFLRIFCKPGAYTESALRFVGEKVNGELLNGTLLAGDQQVGRVTDGIASFVEFDNWPQEKVEKLKAIGQISLNWNNVIDNTNHTPLRKTFCDELVGIAGVILEVAAGPGGGNMPFVLHENPEAMIIVNDLSTGILQLWQAFFKERNLCSSVCLAAFDARKMPIRSGSILAVSSSGGLGGVSGTEVFREASRILESGGILFSVDMILNPQDWAQMPVERKAAWEDGFPGMTQGLARLLEEAGLHIELREILPGRTLDPDEGDLPKEAAKHGVTLHVVYEYVKARKP